MRRSQTQAPVRPNRRGLLIRNYKHLLIHIDNRRPSTDDMKKQSLETQLSIISEKSQDQDIKLKHNWEDEDEVENPDAILDHLISVTSTESDQSYTSSDLYIKRPNRHRGFSLCDLDNEIKTDKKKLSLPTLTVPEILVRRDSKTSLSSTGSEKFDGLAQHYKTFFHLLDEKDGCSDGKIHKESLKNILTTLQSPSDLSLDLRTSNNSLEFRTQISIVDHDKDGFICHDEFADLITNLEEVEDPNQKKINAEMLDNIEKGAYAEVCRTCPPPLFMILISILQLAVFIYHSVQLESVKWTGNAPLCSSLIYNPERRQEVWRYLTYSLVHSGTSHILLNIFIQLVVGLPLEMSHGSCRILLLYTVGVISGSLASSCTEPQVHLAGASSGVYALIAAHISNLILNWKEDVLIVRQNNTMGFSAINGGLIRLLRLTAVVAFVVVDIIIGVYNSFFSSFTSTTSYGAHIAGAGIGLLAGILILNNRKVETWEIWLQLCCYLLLALFFLTTVMWNILGDSIFKTLYDDNFFPSLQTSLDCPYNNGM